MDTFLVTITNYLWSQSWQLALLIVLIAAISWALRNRSAHSRYLLWMIVLVKCLVPPFMTVPVAILPQDKSVEPFRPSPTVEPLMMKEAWDVEEIVPAPMPVISVDKNTEQPKPSRVFLPSVHQLTGAVWIFGIVIFGCVAVARVTRSSRRLRKQRKPLPGRLRDELLSGFEIKVRPRVWLLDGIGQPFVWGLFRGSIYLPTDYLKNDTAAHHRDILGHEVCHVLRLDAAVNLLQIIAQAIFWFHPFVWWANKNIRMEREKCCDEMVIAHLGAKVREYSTAIGKALTTEHESARPVPSMAVAGSVKDIEERIKTMLRPGRNFYKHPSVMTATVVLLLAILTVPTSLVLTAPAATQGQAKPQNETEVPTETAAQSQGTLRLLQGKEGATAMRLSPDGLKMVYSTFDPNLIVVSDLSTGAERKYEQTTPLVSPVWSPDGKRIAFLDGNTTTGWSEWQDQTVSILTLDSGDVEKTDIQGALPCDWSGDGRFLLVIYDGEMDYKIIDYDKIEVQLVDLKTGEEQTVIRPFKGNWVAEWPRLSPDGKYVVYQPENGGIFVQPINGREPIPIISDKEGGVGAGYPLWTADGKNILFMSSRDQGRHHLCSIAFQDGKPLGEPEIVVSDMGDRVTLISCSNSGSLLFTEDDRATRIYTTKIDPVSGSVLGDPEQLTNSKSEASRPAWSLSGKYIAYYNTTESGELILCVMNSDGSDKKTLGSINAFDRGASQWMAWHPDDDHILYAGREADLENPAETLAGIYSISIRSRKRKMVYHDPDFRGGMHLSPDGKHLALISGSKQLYIVGYDGQNRRQLVKSDGAISKPTFTPDGKEIIYTYSVSEEGKEDRRSIMAVSIEGGEPREIYAREDPNDGIDTRPASWLPDGRFVFDIIRRNPGDRAQYAINMDGQSDPVRIFDVSGSSYSISPDGTKAVNSARKWERKVWLMSDFLPNGELAKN